MKSAEADAELDRFSAEIQGIHPLGRNPALSSFEDQISRIRAAKRRSTPTPQP
jgi:hypothetical protein